MPSLVCVIVDELFHSIGSVDGLCGFTLQLGWPSLRVPSCSLVFCLWCFFRLQKILHMIQMNRSALLVRIS